MHPVPAIKGDTIQCAPVRHALPGTVWGNTTAKCIRVGLKARDHDAPTSAENDAAKGIRGGLTNARSTGSVVLGSTVCDTDQATPPHASDAI